MALRGRVRNGIVILDEPTAIPEGYVVSVEVLGPPESVISSSPPRRQGGQWKGRVVMAADCDELPDDLADALGLS